MAKAYYLVDGDIFHGNVLNVPYDGSYKRDFQDISMIDEATIKLGNNIDDALTDVNPRIELSNNYFNVQYPYKKTEVKPFTTITNKDDSTYKLLDGLLSFSEQRKYKVLHGDKVKLTSNTELDKFARYLLHSIFSLTSVEKKQLLSYESLISKRLKELIHSKYNEYYYKSFEEYYNINRKVIMSLFSSYTELRNIVMMLKLIKEGKFENNRSVINACYDSDIRGLYKASPEEIINELRHYKTELRMAEEENRVNEFKESLNNEYYQYELSDFFDLSVEPHKRGRVKDLLDC